VRLKAGVHQLVNDVASVCSTPSVSRYLTDETEMTGAVGRLHRSQKLRPCISTVWLTSLVPVYSSTNVRAPEM
jgi:hypothetical protein